MRHDSWSGRGEAPQRGARASASYCTSEAVQRAYKWRRPRTVRVISNGRFCQQPDQKERGRGLQERGWRRVGNEVLLEDSLASRLATRTELYPYPGMHVRGGGTTRYHHKFEVRTLGVGARAEFRFFFATSQSSA